MEATILIYDASFNGFLSAVFMAYEEKLNVSGFHRHNEGQNLLFTETRRVFTQLDKSKRVWNGIQNKSFSAIKDIYFAFLSEHKGIESLLYRYIVRLFSDSPEGDPDSTEEMAGRIRQLARMVGREKNLSEGDIRFRKTRDGVYFTAIQPEYNILPLVSKHFRSVYPDQEWLIYDSKRHLGLYYNTSFVEIIAMEFKEHCISDLMRRYTVAGQDKSQDSLWTNFLESTSIKAGFISKVHTTGHPQEHWAYKHGKEAV